MNELDNLRELIDDPNCDGFLYHLRMYGKWDRPRFEQLARALRAALPLLDGAENVPRWLAAFFSWAPHSILAMSDRKELMQRPPEGISAAEYSEIVASGRKELKYLMSWFSHGWPPER